MRISWWTSIAFVFVAACSFQASCGGKTLDMDKAKDFVAATLEKETGQKPEASCPASVKIEKGGTFECTAKFGANVAAKIVITQNDEEGNVTIKSITGIVVARNLEKEIADSVGKQVKATVEVNCGDRVRAAVPDATFQCDIKDPAGQSAKVNVKVKDVEAHVSYEVVKG